MIIMRIAEDIVFDCHDPVVPVVRLDADLHVWIFFGKRRVQENVSQKLIHLIVGTVVLKDLPAFITAARELSCGHLFHRIERRELRVIYMRDAEQAVSCIYACAAEDHDCCHRGCRLHHFSGLLFLSARRRADLLFHFIAERNAAQLTIDFFPDLIVFQSNPSKIFFSLFLALLSLCIDAFSDLPITDAISFSVSS